MAKNNGVTPHINKDWFNGMKMSDIQPGTVKIETGIPIPPGRGSKSFEKLPVEKMKVNKTSFWVPVDNGGTSAYCIYLSKKGKLGFKFTCRTEVKNGITGTRVWRTK